MTHISTSVVGLDRIALVCIKPTVLDKLGLAGPLEVAAADGVVHMNLLDVVDLYLPSFAIQLKTQRIAIFMLIHI